MPATEQTWRDTKRMHVIFGITALAMFATTVWMLAADHRREWKDYQRKFRDVESWAIESRIQQQENDEFERELRERVAALVAAEHEVPPAERVNQFEETLTRQAKERGGDPPAIEPLQDAYAKLQSA